MLDSRPDYKMEKQVLLHPLLSNSVVLGKLGKEMFKNQPSSVSNSERLRDLKTFRLVCRNWHQESLKIWDESRSISLTQRKSENDVQGNYLELGSEEGLTITQFMEYFRSDKYQLRSNPCTKFYLKHCLMDRDSSSMNAFWEGVGPLIETLSLEECLFPKVGSDEALRSYFRRIVFEKTPNLSTLILKDNQFEAEEMPEDDLETPPPKKQDVHQSENLKKLVVGGNFPILWSEVFYRCPNLESLTLLREKGVDRNKELSREFEKEATHGRWRNKAEKDAAGICSYPSGIKHFHILDQSFPLDWNELATGFKQVQFPLESFTAQLNSVYPPRAGGQTTLRQMLDGFKETLKVLTVGCVPEDDVTTMFLTTSPFLNIDLNSLTELNLWGTVVGSFHFLHFMPNLERLHIDFSGYNKAPLAHLETQRFRPTDVISRTVHEFPPNNLVMRKLTHLRVDYPFTANDLRILQIWTPNLICLEAMFFDDTLQEMSKLWPELTELSVLFGSHVTDEAVVPSITSLKHLRSFQLEAYCGKGKLAGSSVYNGFLKLPNLEVLKIYVSSRVTPEAELRLKEVIPRVHVMRNYEYHTGLPCCERLNFDRLVFPQVVDFVNSLVDD